MTFSCTEQIGGFNNLEIYTLDECSSWPVLLTDNTSKDVVFTAQGESVDGNLIQESINVDENPRKNTAGKFFAISISFDFASQSPALDQLLDQYKGEPVVAVVCKNFPQKKLFGSNRAALQLDYKVIHGRKPEDGSITRVTIKGNIPNRSVHLLE